MKPHQSSSRKKKRAGRDETKKSPSSRTRLLRASLDRITTLATEAARDGCREVCGLLGDNGDFLELVPVRNKCKTGGGFAFYVGEVRAVKKMVAALGHEIVGTFHSHPVGVASLGRSDILYAEDDSLMLICDVTGREWALWHVKQAKARAAEFAVIESAA